MNTQQADVLFNSGKFNSERKLMLFDLSVGGHHAAYIQHLINYWCEQKFAGKLDILVLTKFIQQHAYVVDIAANSPQHNINFIAITKAEEANLKPHNSAINRGIRAFQEWQLLHKYATALETNHCLIMYFDTCEYPLVLGESLPCSFSGIYFRPTFHYSNFAGYTPTRKERLQQWREKIAMSRILKNHKLQNLFCLDPFISPYINKFDSQVTAVHLPDPVQIHNITKSKVDKIKAELSIYPDRKVFLLFGSLTDGRKGGRQLLEAISALSPELCEQICLLFVGQADPIERIPLEKQIVEIRQSKPVQIICRYEYVPEEDMQAYFHLADVVMATYQKHVGMSGILLQAAAAQKPVLSSNYGLMGELVQRYSLGLTVNSTVPVEIAKGLTQFLTNSTEVVCNPKKMKEFAEQNSADKFAQVIFQHI